MTATEEGQRSPSYLEGLSLSQAVICHSFMYETNAEAGYF